MLAAISWINTTFTHVIHVLVWPLTGFPPIVALALISLVTGLFMLWIYARCSDQDGIRTSKDRIRGYLFGVRIFQHDLAVVWRLQGQVLRETFRYFRYSLTPLAVMLVPLILVLIQLNLFFGLKPLAPGESTLLKVSLDPTTVLDQVRLAANPGIEVETPPVKVPRLQEVVWRVRAAQPGRHVLQIQVGERQFEKEVVVGSDWTAVSALRTSDWFNLLFYSGERPLPAASGVTSIELIHPALSMPIFGLEGDWFLLFIVFSVVAAFGFKSLFGVAL